VTNWGKADGGAPAAAFFPKPMKWLEVEEGCRLRVAAGETGVGAC
jgi:hypothetical protein